MFPLIAFGAAIIGGAITSAISSSGESSRSSESSRAASRAARAPSPQAYVVAPISSAEGQAAQSISLVEAVSRFTV